MLYVFWVGGHSCEQYLRSLDFFVFLKIYCRCLVLLCIFYSAWNLGFASLSILMRRSNDYQSLIQLKKWRSLDSIFVKFEDLHRLAWWWPRRTRVLRRQIIGLTIQQRNKTFLDRITAKVQFVALFLSLLPFLQKILLKLFLLLLFFFKKLLLGKFWYFYPSLLDLSFFIRWFNIFLQSILAVECLGAFSSCIFLIHRLLLL